MDIKKYYETVTDAWRFLRKYMEQIPMSEEKWQDEIAEKILFVESHPATERLARKLMASFEDELEHLDRSAKGIKP